MVNGKLIVCEGLDCTGKTTTIKKILEQKNEQFIYSKGIGSNMFIGKISRKFPSTFLFFIELIYGLTTTIKPSLKKGKIILQDRYTISITSYVPLTNKWHNQLIIKTFKRFILKPDAIVYFYLPVKEHIKRLKQKGAKHELILANNPNLIIQRKKEYLKWYNCFQGPKIKINTLTNNEQETAKKLNSFIDNQSTY
ncbi:MAG: hypothetical protein AABW48_00575 [Nanoarchaeota archaeon]